MKQQYRWLLVVAVGLLAIVAMDIWWAVTYRRDYPLTIDEAGYIAFGLQEHFGLQNGGLHGWWDSVLAQAPYAPLVPAVTSLAFSIKAGVLGAFVVLIAFMALLAFATYGIAERLAGPRLGALAALVVATAPGTFLFVREYVFAIAVAALLSSAVYALLRSDGLRLRRWALACGVALGLMLLARTMTVAFVPVVLVAGLITALVRGSGAGAGEGGIGGRLLNLGLAIVAGFAVAAPWYLPSFDAVFDYLTDYGYGSHAVYYGPEHSLFSWFRLREVANRITLNDLLVPLAALVLIGLIAIAVIAVRRILEAKDRRAAIVALLASDAFTVALVFAGCYAALTSSRNGGEGFTFPVAMLLPPLAVIALRQVRTAVLAPALAVLCLVVGVNVAASTTLWDSLSQVRNVTVPGFGSLPWINGTPAAVSAIRGQAPGPPTRFVQRDKGWGEANRELATTVLELSASGVNQPVAFASRNRALNSSSLFLAGLLHYRQSIWMAQLQAEPDSVDSYVRQLSAPELGLPGILVTMNREEGDFEPIVTQRYAEIAAREAGFKRVKTMVLPDGRQLRVWVRKASPS
ncbi:MAG TPA: glycosyltransferase family 39 protein [Solirubrobacterales bacterium]|nr:glycosyltransferase family 39 protein [Solirubrobacterales bacterium]